MEGEGEPAGGGRGGGAHLVMVNSSSTFRLPTTSVFLHGRETLVEGRGELGSQCTHARYGPGDVAAREERRGRGWVEQRLGASFPPTYQVHSFMMVV